MGFRAFAVLAACLIAATPAGAAVEGDQCAGEIRSPYAAEAWYGHELLPGLSWNAVARLLDVPWTPAEIGAKHRFPTDAAIAAAEAVAAMPVTPERPWGFYETYRPIGTASAAEAAAYQAAAARYRKQDWAGAIPLFDAIAATPSPYRAAAAYSAARATFYLGDHVDGIRRIDRLLSTPDLREFHRAAYRLIGTLANQTGAAPLVAARFAQISHYLSAPLDLICRDGELRTLAQNAQNELTYILPKVYPGDHFDHSRWTGQTRAILDALAARDPLLDLVRVVAAPTPFAPSFGTDRGPAHGWVETFPGTGGDHRDRAARAAAAAEAEALTAHARRLWQETRNPLWGYALATRTTTPDDLPILRDILDAIDRLPNHPERVRTKSNLYRQISTQQARLLLMNGRMDAALAALEAGLTWRGADARMAWRDSGMWRASTPEAVVLNGGIRFLLERRDLDAARRWAETAGNLVSRAHGSGPDPELKLLLAHTWEDLVAVAQNVQSGAAALDLLPARKLVALGQRPGLAGDSRRVLLSAGWVRLYMLGRDKEFLALVPEMREAFPEFSADFDAITGAWTERTRRNRVTHLLLRAPGLSPRVAWSRAARPKSAYNPDLFAIDDWAPNDGNWWCPLDVARAKIDVLGDFFVSPIAPHRARPFSKASLDGFWPFADSDRDALRALADDLIAWHPLFREVDFAELEQLSAVASGPRRLGEAAVAWAEDSNPITRWLGLDRALPETLHLAVRSTRYGCRIAGGHGAYSRAAFAALHRIYPKSEWTARTPYWFDRPGRN